MPLKEHPDYKEDGFSHCIILQKKSYYYDYLIIVASKELFFYES